MVTIKVFEEELMSSFLMIIARVFEELQVTIVHYINHMINIYLYIFKDARILLLKNCKSCNKYSQILSYNKVKKENILN